MTLAKRVIARRQELNMTQEELAHKMGLKSRSSIAKIESGRPAQQRTIENLAQALDVTLAYLMGWDDSPEVQAELDASILQDEDLMEIIRIYMAMNSEQKVAFTQMAFKQMAKILSKT